MSPPSPEGAERRLARRHAPQTRAAVWFDFGPEIGETCELKDISRSGFSVQCNEWQLAAFLASDMRPLYCVVLMGSAHFGCLARMAAPSTQHAGRIGFRFEAVPEDSVRLLDGLIGFMAMREAEKSRAE